MQSIEDCLPGHSVDLADVGPFHKPMGFVKALAGFDEVFKGGVLR